MNKKNTAAGKRGKQGAKLPGWLPDVANGASAPKHGAKTASKRPGFLPEFPNAPQAKPPKGGGRTSAPSGSKPGKSAPAKFADSKPLKKKKI